MSVADRCQHGQSRGGGSAELTMRCHSEIDEDMEDLICLSFNSGAGKQCEEEIYEMRPAY